MHYISVADIIAYRVFIWRLLSFKLTATVWKIHNYHKNAWILKNSVLFFLWDIQVNWKSFKNILDHFEGLFSILSLFLSPTQPIGHLLAFINDFLFFFSLSHSSQKPQGWLRKPLLSTILRNSLTKNSPEGVKIWLWNFAWGPKYPITTTVVFWTSAQECDSGKWR